MKNNLDRIFLLLVMTMLSPAHGAAPAQPATASHGAESAHGHKSPHGTKSALGADSAHVKAVGAILGALQFDTMIRQAWMKSKSPRVGHRQTVQHMAQHVPKEAILKRFAPIFAAHIDMATARQITKAPGSDTSKGLYDKAKVDVRAEALEEMAHWAEDYHTDLFVAALEKANAQVDAMVKLAQKGVDPVPAKSLPIGVDHIDEMVRVVLDTGLGTSKAMAKLNREFDVVALGKLVSPDKLVVPAQVAASRRQLDSAGRAMDTYLNAVKARLQESSGLYKKIDFAGAMPDGERTKSKLLTGMQRRQEQAELFGKKHRALLAAETSILDFAEARTGKMAYEGGRLTFRDKADSAAYTQVYRGFQRAMRAAQAPAPATPLQ